LLLVFALAFSLILSNGCSRREKSGTAFVEELNLPGELSDFLMADFNGDSLMEILALCADCRAPVPLRKGCLFFQSGGAYKSDPDLVFDIPHDAVVFDTGDIDGDNRPEILYLSYEGLYAIKVTDSKVEAPRQVVGKTSIFYLPTTESVSYWDFYRVSPRNNRTFLLIPTFSSLSIYSVDNSGVAPVTDIPIQHRAAAQSAGISEMRDRMTFTYQYSLPVIEFCDYNGDGIEDMFVIDDTQMSIFEGTFQGGFIKDRDDRSYETLWPEADAGDIEFSLQVEDLNRDGLADLIVSQNRGGVKNLESNIKIYLCNAREGYHEIPSFSRNISNSAGTTYLHDLNNDGRVDIVIPALKIGITALMKMLILSRLDLGLEIYLQEVGGRYPDEPSLSTSISATVDLNAGNISYGENIAITGDFNGDNLSDFLIETGDGTLDIYFGAIGTVLAGKPGWSYKLPKPSSILAADCDNDGISEILAFYGSAEDDRGKIRVVRVGQAEM
jgi:hypothetical protein